MIEDYVSFRFHHKCPHVAHIREWLVENEIFFEWVRNLYGPIVGIRVPVADATLFKLYWGDVLLPF